METNGLPNEKVIMAGRKKKSAQQPFSQILVSIMKERGLKQADVAKLAGTSVSTVSDWCTGVTPSDMLRVKALAEGLNVSMAFLLTGTHESLDPNKEPLEAEVILDGDVILDGLFRINLKRIHPVTAKIIKPKE